MFNFVFLYTYFIFQAIVLAFHANKIADYSFQVVNYCETIVYGFSLLFVPELTEAILNYSQNKLNHFKFCLNAPDNYELPVKGDTIKGQVIFIYF